MSRSGRADDPGRRAPAGGGRPATSPAGHPAGTTAPAARSHWTPILGFVLISSANQMLWLNFAPITTGTARRLGTSTSAIGVLSEIFPLIYVVLALPMGLALDRWFRPSLATGAALTAGGACLRLAGHGFVPVLVGQLVVAIGQPLVLSAVTGLATRSLQPADRPVGIAVGSAGTFLGFVVAFVLGLALGSQRLHALLVVSAVYSVVGAGAVVVALRAVPGASGRAAGDRVGSGAGSRTGREPTPDGAGGSGPRWDEQLAGLRTVWRDGVIRTTVTIVFFGFGVFVALTTWVQTLLQPSGIDERTADGLLVAMVAAGTVSSVLLPPFVAVRRRQPSAIAVAALGGLAACVVLAAFPGRATGSVALAGFGLVLLPALPILLELIEHRLPELAGTATALLWLTGNAGGLVVALAVGTLTGHPGAAFGLMGGVALVVLPLAVGLRRHLAVATDAGGVDH